ncbi:MAG: hypothetical protein AAGD10_11980 [Myxococcota bacterium]
MMLSVVLLSSLFLAEPAPDRVNALMAGQGRLPSLWSLLEVDAKAHLRSARRRARWRGLVPQLRGRFGTDLDLDVRDASQRVVTETRALGGSVQASFDLSRLVFDDREVALELQRQRLDERLRLRRRRIVELYMGRLRLELRLEAEGPSLPACLEAAELDARLTVLCDGAYRVSSPSCSSVAAGHWSPRRGPQSSGSGP